MSNENTYNAAMNIGRREILGLTYRTEEETLAKVKAVTLAQINECATKIFDMKNVCSCYAGCCKAE